MEPTTRPPTLFAIAPQHTASKIFPSHHMKNSDKQNACIEHDRTLQRAIVNLLTDLIKQFSANPSFKKWLGDATLTEPYHQG